MSSKNLKLPMIFRDLDEVAMDLGEWKPEIEERVGLGPWTFSDICRIVDLCLAESNKLLAKVNGIKLEKEEQKELAEFRTFFKEIKVIWQSAEGKTARKGA